jgi:DNA repair exonuclease SbcCD ATPase subunit
MIIAHAADIHIFLNKRHEEHEYVFNNLYKSLRENNVDRIVVTGDIFQSKTTLSPEAVKTAYYLFLNLSEIASVDIIIGNHDTNLKNNERLDSITPIVDTITTNKFPIKIYSKSGLYKITKKITYGVFSCIDEENFPIEFDKEEDTINIALFHGPLSGVKLTDGFDLEETKYSTDLFKNYDVALCGDIHINQNLKNAYYPGSLLSLDFSEGNREHGYLLWDINLDNHKIEDKFIQIQNDWGFFDLKTNEKFDKNNIPVFENICKYPRIKLTLLEHEYSLTEKKELELAIREKYNPIELIILNDIKSISKNEEYQKLGDITQLSTQQELLKKHLKDHKDKEQVSRILLLNEKTFNEVPRENILKNIKWNFKSFNFNNIFSFGKNNKFDFTKYKGIVLINGKNAKGKTNFFNSLLYTMFNTTDKTSEIKDIINYNEKECDGEIVIDNNDEQYRIIRKSNKTTKSTSTSLDYTKFDESRQQWISLNSDTRPNTDKLIQKTFGSYDDMIISSFSPQGKVSEFLDKGTGAAFLLDLISKFLGVNIYTNIHEIANKEYKKIKTIFDSFEKLDYANIIIEHKDNIILEKEKIETCNKGKYLYEMSISELEASIEIEQSGIKFIPENINSDITKESQALKNIEDKKIERETLKNTIQSFELRKNDDITTIDSKLLNKKTNKEKEIETIKSAIENFDITTVDSKLLEQKTEKEQNILDIKLLISKIYAWIKIQDKNKFTTEIEKFELLADKQVKLELQIYKKEAETKKDLHSVDILNSQKWNDGEELCKNCTLYIEASKLRENVNEIKNEIELLLLEFEANKEILNDTEHYKKDLSLYEKREKELSDLENKLKLETSNLSSIQLKINNYLEKLKSDLEQLKKKLETEKSNLSSIELEITLDLQKRKSQQEKILSDINLKKSELNTLEAELKNLILNYTEIQNKNKEYDKYNEIEEENKRINDKISEIKSNILTKKNSLNNIQYDIISSEKRITEFETKIIQLEEILQKIKQYEQLNSDYEIYLKAIHREGIPYNIISMSIDIINSEVNKIIEQIEDFRVYFEPNLDKKEIDIRIHHQDGRSNPIQTGSGMEKTITALAIRDALVNISNIPRCNIFVMDESIQTFDNDHLSVVGKLFDYLKQRYDTIFVISHLETIKEYADYTINVDNSSGYTKFEFLN